jgi:transposase-like protein
VAATNLNEGGVMESKPKCPNCKSEKVISEESAISRTGQGAKEIKGQEKYWVCQACIHRWPKVPN